MRSGQPIAARSSPRVVIIVQAQHATDARLEAGRNLARLAEVTRGGLPQERHRKIVSGGVWTYGMGQAVTNDYDTMLWFRKRPFRPSRARSGDLTARSRDFTGFSAELRFRSPGPCSQIHDRGTIDWQCSARRAWPCNCEKHSQSRRRGKPGLLKASPKRWRMPSLNNPRPSSEVASRRMKAVGQRDTAAEMEVRRRVHAKGMRYRVDFRDSRS